jgi:hypothetical protein
MNPNYMKRADLAQFGREVATRIASGKVSGLRPEQLSHFATVIADLSSELASADLQQLDLRLASLESTRRAQDKRVLLLKALQEFKYTMKSLRSPAREFDSVGFDPPAKVRRIVTPQTPCGLSSSGFSNGVNELKFTGNNPPKSVTYIIEAKIGDSPRYVIVGISRNQRFRHIGVRPGEMHQYRIRAQSARGLVSDWSNEAVVYRL